MLVSWYLVIWILLDLDKLNNEMGEALTKYLGGVIPGTKCIGGKTVLSILYHVNALRQTVDVPRSNPSAIDLS